MNRSRLQAAVAALWVAAITGCLNDTPSAPIGSAVRLRLDAQIVDKSEVATADRTVAIRVFYRRGSGESITQVDLPIDPKQITVPSGTTTQAEVTVQISACLSDPQRVGGPGCHFSVQLTLLDADGGVLSTQTQDVDASTPGQTVTVPKITLLQAEIGLSQPALTFTTQEQSATLPTASSVAISSVTGVSLGTLTVNSTFGTGATGWLRADLSSDQSSLTIQPKTTNLAAGTYTATVTVTSSRSSIAPKTVAVTYTLTHQPQRLTITGVGTGGGRIVSTPAGIDCTVAAGNVSGTCQFDFTFGTAVSLAATSASNSDFSAFGGACSGSTCQVTMDQARGVSATFQLKQFAITVTGGGTGNGTVTSNPSGINCTVSNALTSGTCTASFAAGTQVALSGAAAANSDFTGFSGDCTGATCQVTVDQARSVAATFTLKTFKLTLVGAGTGSGSVVSTPAGMNCTVTAGISSGTCTADFVSGTVVSLTPAAAANSNFIGFTGACTGDSCQVTMDQPKSVTATFSLKTFTLSVAAGGGSGRVVSKPAGVDCTVNGTTTSGSCNGSFNIGTQVTLTATAAGGQFFAGYTGDCTGLTCQLTMNQVHSVTATFASGTFFSDNFETVTSWTATGFWNRINLSTSTIVNKLVPLFVSLAPDDNSGGKLPQANSGSYAFWYGQPSTGSFIGAQTASDAPKSGGTSAVANSGTLTSPAFAIPANAPTATLTFAYWYEVEGVDPSHFDLMTVQVLDPATGALSGGATLNPANQPISEQADAPFSSAGFNLAPIWTSTQIDLSAYKGKTVQLVFTFATGDNQYNGFRGLIVDDVVVDTRVIPASAALIKFAAPGTKPVPGVRKPRTLRSIRLHP